MVTWADPRFLERGFMHKGVVVVVVVGGEGGVRAAEFFSFFLNIHRDQIISFF